MKQNILDLKNEIKRLSNEQKVVKNQRKTKNLIGERIMPPHGYWDAEKKKWVYGASEKHYINRNELRYLLYAYAVLRNRPTESVTPKSENKSIIKKYLDSILEKYGKAIHNSEK